MFLTQLALGDESAVVSLKALIPDREDIDGMLNYGENGKEIYTDYTDAAAATPPPQTDAQKKAAEAKISDRLKAKAADPLLRRLETAHILATESGAEQWYRDGQQTGALRSANCR